MKWWSVELKQLVCLSQNLTMQRVISIPIQSTSTINIHVPIGDVISRQQQQQQQQQHAYDRKPSLENGCAGAGADRQHHVTRMSITSNGSSIVSVSPSTTPHHSRSSSIVSPPATPLSPKYVNGVMTREETFDADSAVGSSHDDSRSIHSTGSAGGEPGSAETSSHGASTDSHNNNDDDIGHCAVALFVDKHMAVLVKVTYNCNRLDAVELSLN